MRASAVLILIEELACSMLQVLGAKANLSFAFALSFPLRRLLGTAWGAGSSRCTALLGSVLARVLS